MKSSKQQTQKTNKEAPPSNSLKQALLGLYGIIGLSISAFGPFKVPFAEANAKEHWRHALVGILLFLALIAALVSVAIFMFDANYFKSQMVDYVKTHNQRDMTLEGDIKVTFFPKLGLDAGKITLSQRNSGKSFASIENAKLYVAWLPLIRKQLQIERIALDGVHANVIRYKNGSTNLDDLLATEGSLSDIKFEIDSIKLKNSSINLQEESGGLFFALHDLEVTTGRLTDSTPGNIYASFRLESNKPRIDTRVKLNSHVFFELKTNHYEFANFEGELEGEALGINNLALNFQGTINSYPSTETLVVDKFVAQARGKFGNRKLDAKLDIPKISLVKGKLTGSMLGFNSSLLQDEENLTISFEAPAFEWSNKIFQSENISATLDLFLAGRTLQSKLNSPFNLNLETMQLQLPAIVSNLSGSHPALAGKLSGSLNGNLQMNLADKSAKLGFKGKVDESNINGTIGMLDFAKSAYTFDLSINKLDLDHYLATDWSKRLLDDTLPFDFSALKNMNLRGKLRSSEFKLAKLKMLNMSTDIKAEQSSLNIEPFNAKLYGGALSGSLMISAQDTPKIVLAQKLSGVQIDALLGDVIQGESKLTGKGNIAYELAANGINMGAMRKTATGNVSIALGRGSLAGNNLLESLLAGKAQLGITDAVRSDAAKFTESTAYSEFKSTFEISEGRAKTTDFLMKSALFSSKGEGEITLDKGQLSFNINTQIAANLKKASGEIAELRGISLPMRISGPYTAPTVIYEFALASGGMLDKPPVKTKTVNPSTTPAVKSKPAKK